jgi:4-amino-4-deoxy-L-arabinose transferase-like glycosyltransferase
MLRGWLLIVVAVLAFRLPPMLRQPGRIDEECYAVPGWTILRTGLPQLPNLPSRNPESMFYRADEVLYAEPPLYFYLQAAVYSVLPITYGTARLLSAAAAVGMLWATLQLALRTTGSAAAALWGTGLFAVSRWLAYPATIARADIFCAWFGLLAVMAAFRWERSRQARWLAMSGAWIGLGALMHPLAIVYAVQIAAWVAVAARGRDRLLLPALTAAVSLAVFALWLPLILIDPELFAIQFRNQFLGRSGETLSWIRRPAASLWYHARFLWLYMNAWQCSLILAGGAASFVAARRTGRRELRILLHLAWSGFLLIGLIVGTHHDVPGYWAYPAALGFIGVGCALAAAGGALFRAAPPLVARGAAIVAAMVLAAAMIPGSGARLFLTHVRHWSDVNYNAPAFAQALLAEIPASAACTVDHEYLLDFIVAGRPVLGIPTSRIYLNAEDYPYDLLVVSRFGLRENVPQEYGAVRRQAVGIADDELACYAELHVPRAETRSRWSHARP